MIKYLISLTLIFTTGNQPVDSNLRQAVRLHNAYQETPLPPPPEVLNPNRLTGCDELNWYRQNVGLPIIFNSLGYRESNCRNDVRTFCCFGYWQLYINLFLQSNSSYQDRIKKECLVNSVIDIYGLSDEQKYKQACVTYVVYSISGLVPWNK